MLHPAMRPKPSDWKGQPYNWAELKFDGWRATLYKEGTAARLIGRKEHLDLLDGLSSSLKQQLLAVPGDSVVDGELWAPGHKATSVPALLKRRSRCLLFSAFAVPFLGGADLRKVSLAERDAALLSIGLEPPARYDLPPTPANAKELGIEGFVLKLEHYAGWYRVKRDYTVDLVVCGWTPGKGKHAGRIGSLDGCLFGQPSIASVGGLTDADRVLDPSSLIGRVMEVSYDEVASRGRLKFARFIRWRDDKPAEECR